MRKPKDPTREERRPVTDTYRCPFCGAELAPHCYGKNKSSTCDILRCTRCSAYGPKEGMVIR